MKGPITCKGFSHVALSEEREIVLPVKCREVITQSVRCIRAMVSSSTDLSMFS